ncbi:MAG TPA: hypothetical protein VIL20_15525 [Sandaracinaceae bacterium]
MAFWTSLLAAVFVYVSVHGAVFGLVQIASSRDGDVADELAEVDPPGEPGGDSEDGDRDDSQPRPPSQLDEDDVKHCAVAASFALGSAGGRLGDLHRDELARHRDHLHDLERPPRA